MQILSQGSGLGPQSLTIVLCAVNPRPTFGGIRPQAMCYWGSHNSIDNP